MNDVSNATKFIRVRVLLFAVLAEIAAVREVELELAPETTVRDAVNALVQTHPSLEKSPLIHAFFAVNETYAPEDTVLQDGDELALIPPVSGGAGDNDGKNYANGSTKASSGGGRFLITAEPLQPDVLSKFVRGPQMGGLCTFVGTVRGVTGERRTKKLFYEAYAPMAVAEMERIAADVRRRWPDVEIAMHHRIGEVHVGEIAVVIVAAGPHRDSAFPACRFGIDEVKRRCPIWKKEFYSDGTVEWGAPDEAATKGERSL